MSINKAFQEKKTKEAEIIDELRTKAIKDVAGDIAALAAEAASAAKAPTTKDCIANVVDELAEVVDLTTGLAAKMAIEEKASAQETEEDMQKEMEAAQKAMKALLNHISGLAEDVHPLVASVSVWTNFVSENIHRANDAQPALVLATICAMEAFAENKTAAEVKAAIEQVKGLKAGQDVLAGQNAIRHFHDKYSQSLFSFKLSLIP